MAENSTRLRTGVEGLDDVLFGGLLPHRLYLLEGMPGSGKTTLAFQFLLEGVRRGEPVLYVTLSETEEEIRDVATSHGWTLDGVTIRELTATESALNVEEQYTVFHPADVELTETTKRLLDDVETVAPTRIVFDSLSEFRLLAGNPLRYRRQILALKQYFAGRQSTVLLLDDLTAAEHDLQVQSIAHGAVLLEHSIPAFGSLRRRLSITKFRGSDFRGGYHDYCIRRGGLEVFPRLVASEHRGESSRERLSSGLEGIDRLLGGGIGRGTSTLVQGASGTGKSTIAALFCTHAASLGHKSSLFIFDESINTLLARLDGLGVPLREHYTAGRVKIQQVDPAEFSLGELSHSIQQTVESDGAIIIVIDSLNGFLHSMPEEELLVVHLHELLTYLGQRGVATMLVSTHQGVIGPSMTAPVDASYLADAVLLLRYFEVEGEVRQAISAIKMRGGEHERTIRELIMRGGRIHVGEPLRDYRGVLTGTPEKLPPV